MSAERADFWERLPVWARPPQLPDAVENERARLLWTLFCALLVFLGPIMAVGIFFGPNKGLAAVIYSVVGVFSLTCLRLIRAGRIRAAALTYLVTHWVLLFCITLFMGGISQSHASGLIIITILAGLTMGTRAGAVVAAVSVVAIVILAGIEKAGMLPPSPMPFGLLEDATSLIANVVLGAVFVTLSVRGLTRAVLREQESAGRYRALAEQRAAHGALGQYAVTAPSAEHLAEQAAVILERTLGARAVLIVDSAERDLRALGVRGVTPDVAVSVGRAHPDEAVASLKADGMPELLPPGPLVVASIPSRRGSRGIVAVVLGGSDPAGAVAFVEAVGALIGSALERDENQKQLRQAQKMELVGRLAGGVAHDFNNLLTAIGGSASILVEELPVDDVNADLARDILAASDRAALLTRQLLAFSRKQMLKPERVDLSGLVREFRSVLQRLLRADVRIELDPAMRPAFVLADRSCLEQVLLNLVVNARDAMPDGGRLLLSTRSIAGEGDAESAWAVLSVRDTGQGMSTATRERMFEPFFTTKSDGTGLGLATVLDIVKRSNGRVEVHSEEAVGTTFDVFFPAVEDVGAEPATSAIRRAPGGSETLLIVDDEASVRSTTRRILERAGYSVIEATNAAEGLAKAASKDDIALILTDVVMPGRGGIALAGDLAKAGKRVLLLSGYAEALTADAPWPFLAKPFTSSELLVKVREVLDGRR